jgi:hypothetical protein
MPSLINASPAFEPGAGDPSAGSRSSFLNGTQALASPPTAADAWDANSKAYGDFVAEQRADGIAKGLLDPQTGWPTKAGLEDAAKQLADSIMLGTTAPGEAVPQLITSQHYLSEALVAAKQVAKDYTVKVSPTFHVEGQPYQAIIDGHHALAAAHADGATPNIVEATPQDHDAIGLLHAGKVEDFLDAIHMGEGDYIDPQTRRDIDFGAAAKLDNSLLNGTPNFTAYHGSPHSFDQFDSSKIGTGEGAQAYGHGLYFADSEGVARNYRDSMSDPKFDGRVYNATDPLHRSAFYVDMLNLGDRSAALQQIDNEIVQMKDKASQATGFDLRGNPNSLFYDNAVTRLNEMRPLVADPAVALPKVTDKGHMYEVQVNADPSHFLDWDKPLSQQSPHVQEALGQFGIKPLTYEVAPKGDGFGVTFSDGAAMQRTFDTAAEANKQASLTARMSDPTGGSVYEHPNIVPGSYRDAAAAAQALQAAGIPGIRYLDGGSRAGGQGTSNHVVFDPATIAILRKYGIAGLMAGGAAAAQAGPSP